MNHSDRNWNIAGTRRLGTDASAEDTASLTRYLLLTRYGIRLFSTRFLSCSRVCLALIPGTATAAAARQALRICFLNRAILGRAGFLSRFFLGGFPCGFLGARLNSSPSTRRVRRRGRRSRFGAASFEGESSPRFSDFALREPPREPRDLEPREREPREERELPREERESP